MDLRVHLHLLLHHQAWHLIHNTSLICSTVPTPVMLRGPPLSLRTTVRSASDPLVCSGHRGAHPNIKNPKKNPSRIRMSTTLRLPPKWRLSFGRSTVCFIPQALESGFTVPLIPVFLYPPHSVLSVSVRYIISLQTLVLWI